MGKLQIEDLARIREATQYQTAVRQGSARAKITVHMGTCGIAAGARDILMSVMKAIEERHLHDVIVTNSGCAGHCDREPMMTVHIAGGSAPVQYVSLTAEKVSRIMDSHVLGGRIVQDYTLAMSGETPR